MFGARRRRRDLGRLGGARRAGGRAAPTAWPCAGRSWPWPTRGASPRRDMPENDATPAIEVDPAHVRGAHRRRARDRGPGGRPAPGPALLHCSERGLGGGRCSSCSLADGRFPGGGYAHSGGLEAAVAEGAVDDVGHAARPSLRGPAGHGRPGRRLAGRARPAGATTRLGPWRLEGEARTPRRRCGPPAGRWAGACGRGAALTWPAVGRLRRRAAPGRARRGRRAPPGSTPTAAARLAVARHLLGPAHGGAQAGALDMAEVVGRWPRAGPAGRRHRRPAASTRPTVPMPAAPLLEAAGRTPRPLGGAALCLMTTTSRRMPTTTSTTTSTPTRPTTALARRPGRCGSASAARSARGKTALVVALCRRCRADGRSVAVVTNDIYTAGGRRHRAAGRRARPTSGSWRSRPAAAPTPPSATTSPPTSTRSSGSTAATPTVDGRARGVGRRQPDRHLQPARWSTCSSS